MPRQQEVLWLMITVTLRPLFMSRSSLLFVIASVLLTGCNPFEPVGGYEYKDCQYTLRKEAGYKDMSGSARLAFLERCRAGRGLQPAPKCVEAQAQGKPHCEYEPAPSKPQFRW